MLYGYLWWHLQPIQCDNEEARHRHDLHRPERLGRGDTEGLSIQVELNAKKGSNTVYVNGKETKDYTKKDGKIVVSVPFASAIIEVR